MGTKISHGAEHNHQYFRSVVDDAGLIYVNVRIHPDDKEELKRRVKDLTDKATAIFNARPGRPTVGVGSVRGPDGKFRARE